MAPPALSTDRTQAPGWLTALGFVLLCNAVLAMTIVYFRRDRIAGAMVLPLLVWVSFATALNASIWWLSR